MRVLAADLGERLGCGAHLAALRRTRSGPFTLDQARTPEELEAVAEEGQLAGQLLPPLGVLGLPALRLEGEEIRRSSAAARSRPDSREAPGTRMAAHDARGRGGGDRRAAPRAPAPTLAGAAGLRG